MFNQMVFLNWNFQNWKIFDVILDLQILQKVTEKLNSLYRSSEKVISIHTKSHCLFSSELFFISIKKDLIPMFIDWRTNDPTDGVDEQREGSANTRQNWFK